MKQTKTTTTINWTKNGHKGTSVADDSYIDRFVDFLTRNGYKITGMH